jgi:hypothetical protein
MTFGRRVGVRLLGLCHIAAQVESGEVKALASLLTEPERKAIVTRRENEG